MKLTMVIFGLFSINLAYSQQYELSLENQIERERMLKSLQEYEVSPVVFPEYRSAPLMHQKLLSHYRQHLVPTTNKIEKLNYLSNIYHLLVDRAFYTSDAEKEDWQKIEQETDSEIRRLANSPEYLKAKIRLIELAEGLPDSNFTRYIKKMKEDFEFQKLDDEQQAIAKQISDEFLNINNILNTSPYVSEVQKYGPIAQKVMKEFHAGKISIDEGRKILKDAYAGYEKHVEYYATKGMENFANMAKQKTLLAKSKGFENYAHYALYEQRDGYQGELVEVDTRRQFLRNFLNNTQAIAKQYLSARYEHVMKQKMPDKLPEFINSFLSPQTTGLIDEYFPKEKIVQVWRQTMLESGFDQETLEQIIVDEFPRERKYYHAYLQSTKTPTPKKLSINAQTLEVKDPIRNSSWTTPESYIIQNFKTDGPSSAETAFHEGGHALENSFKRPLYLDNSSYAYVEIHSMTMEYFFRDLEFLTKKGINAKGEKLPVDLALKFIENSNIASLNNFRGMAKKALYELELWDYDFSQPGAKTFLERAVEVGEALDKEFLVVASERASTNIDHWANFITVHHWGRNIRYIGYFLAEASSMMNAQYLWNKFAADTGRKTLNSQPTLAKLLTEGYYKKGFELPFPLAVEKFTGEPFAFDKLIQSQAEIIEKHINELDCNKHLK